MYAQSSQWGWVDNTQEYTPGEISSIIITSISTSSASGTKVELIKGTWPDNFGK